MNLFTHYELFMTNLGQTVVNDTIYRGKRPLMCQGVEVKLPTPTALAGVVGESLLFHPIGESLIHNDSLTLNLVNKLVNTRINHVFALTINTMLEKLEPDTKLTKAQRTLLEGLGDMKPTAIKTMVELLKKIDPNVLSKRLINLTVESDAVIGDDRFKRYCKVTSPLLTYLEHHETGGKIWGIKPNSNKDVKHLIVLLKNLLPEIGVGYSSGNNNRISPNYLSLLTSYRNTLTTILDAAKTLGSTPVTDLALDFGFMADLENNLVGFEAAAPRDLPGNLGELSLGKGTAESAIVSSEKPEEPVINSNASETVVENVFDKPDEEDTCVFTHKAPEVNTSTGCTCNCGNNQHNTADDPWSISPAAHKQVLDANEPKFGYDAPANYNAPSNNPNQQSEADFKW